jgi:lysophospholipase L1-like esterase
MRRNILRFVVLCVSIIFSLGIAELVVSFLKLAPAFHAINLFQIEGRAEIYQLSPNPKLIYVPAPNAGGRNSYGHRGKNYSFGKSNKIRIVFMGDSVVEGLEIVSPEERFTEILNDKLGEEFEVINLGVPGYNFVQELEYLKTVGLKFEPDYVFWGVCYNDMWIRSLELNKLSEKLQAISRNAFYEKFYKTKSYFERIMFRSSLYRYVKYSFSKSTRLRFMDLFVNALTLEEEVLKNLVQECDLLSRNKFRQAFYLLPINEGSLSAGEKTLLKKFKALIKNKGFLSIDLNEYFDALYGRQFKNNLLADGCHLNANGHRLVAEAIYNFMKDNANFQDYGDMRNNQ